MKRLIDVDEMLRISKDGKYAWVYDLTDLEEFLELVPTVEAVEVVRCKDCEYWQDNNEGYPHPECRWAHDETPDEDDFCSYGERRSD